MSGRIPRCDICGARDAEYVCRQCGRLVCRFDFDPYMAICGECGEPGKVYRAPREAYPVFDLKGLILIFIGIAIVFLGFILMASPGFTVPSDGGLVIIGPFPPIVMTGEYAFFFGLIYLLVFLGLIFLVFWYFRRIASRGL